MLLLKVGAGRSAETGARQTMLYERLFRAIGNGSMAALREVRVFGKPGGHRANGKEACIRCDGRGIKCPRDVNDALALYRGVDRS